jgi:hypothetical protein
MSSPRTHRDLILDQFTRQAVPFSFAAVARHVTGFDLTPAMIDRARALQRERGFANVTRVLPLRYEDATFSPGGADRIREMFVASLADDALGVGARRHDGAIHLACPVAILASRRAA